MKTRTVWHFDFSGKAARAALAALAFSACKDGTGAHRKVAAASTPDNAAAVRATAPRPVRSAPSPELQSELDRRRTAWVEKPLTEGDNRMTPERLRGVHMSRFELTSLAQEAAMIDMGLAETEKAALRRILTDFRDAVLLRIEHPGRGKDASPPTVDELFNGIDDPSTPSNLYVERMRARLGEAGHAEFTRLELQERAKLIAARRAFRRPIVNPAPPSSQAPPPSRAQAPGN